MNKEEQNVSLRFTQGSSDKVYNVFLNRYEKDADNCGWTVETAYGRYGKTLNYGSKTTKPLSYEKALQLYVKLIAQKKARGYVIQGVSTDFTAPIDDKIHTGWVPQLLYQVEQNEAMDLFHHMTVYAQVKHDGERRAVIMSGTKITGANRLGFEVPIRDDIYKELDDLNNLHPFNFTLDCEDMGDHYVIFDVMDEGENECFSYRAKRLNNLAAAIEEQGYKHLKVERAYCCNFRSNMVDFIKKARSNREEGVVFRDGSKVYTPGKGTKNGAAFKLKFYSDCTCRVGSVHPSKRSIGLQLFNEKGLGVDVGNCTIPMNHRMPNVYDLVDIKYLYAYKGGSLYQPIYKGKRLDLDDSAAVLSQLKYKKGQ
jgi:bifunctional non-homologous end joining protein LigD